MNKVVEIEKQMQESRTEPRIIGEISLQYEEDAEMNTMIHEDESLGQSESIISQSSIPLIIQWNFINKK